jgi:hypothetical protein
LDESLYELVAADAARNQVSVTGWITSAIGLALQGQVLEAEEGVRVVDPDAIPVVSAPKATIRTPAEAEEAVSRARPAAERNEWAITKAMTAGRKEKKR